MEEDKRMHTIRIDADTELNLRIPDIMDLEDLNSIVDKVESLKGVTKGEKQPKKVVEEGVVDIESACKEYLSAPWGQKEAVAEKYGIGLNTLKWNVRKAKRGKFVKPKAERKEIIAGDLWKDYQDAPFGQKEAVAEKYGLTLASLRTYIHGIRQRLGMAKSTTNNREMIPRKKFSDELIDDSIRLLKEGNSTKEVARIKGFDRTKQMIDTIYHRRHLKIGDLR